MKKLFALILAGAMAISMVACASKGSDNSGDTDSEGKLKVQLIVSFPFSEKTKNARDDRTFS